MTPTDIAIAYLIAHPGAALTGMLSHAASLGAALFVGMVAGRLLRAAVDR